jgi:hypothetical protein
MLEIPMTAGFVGSLRSTGPSMHGLLRSRAGLAMRMPGIFARLGLFERIVLTPEGITSEEHRRLTRTLLASGQRVFSFTYHSPSLEPGHTPYVRSQSDLTAFLDRFERYFDFFFGDIGGRSATPLEIRDMLAFDRGSASEGAAAA